MDEQTSKKWDVEDFEESDIVGVPNHLAEVYSWVSDEIDAEAKGDVVENMRIWGEVVENAYGPNLICCKRWNSTCSFPSQH